MATFHRFSTNQPFKAEVVLGKKTFGDTTFEVFQISIVGLVSVPYDNYPIRHSVSAVDVTDGESYPILCPLEALQSDGKPWFEFVSKQESMPYKVSRLARPITILAVPTDPLVFPYRGLRQIKFTVSILHGFRNTVICSSTCSIRHRATEIGYMEAVDNLLLASELAVKLAMAVSAVDGQADAKEGEVVREWIQAQISAAADGDETKERLNDAAKEAFATINSGRTLDIADICTKLKDVATSALKYDILELCIKVVGADDRAQASEFEIINKIAKLLEIDMDKYRSMVEKIIPIHIIEVEDAERLLAMPADATTEQKKEILRKEYRKWNSRITHSDPKIREQAEKMLEIIALERSKL